VIGRQRDWVDSQSKQDPFRTLAHDYIIIDFWSQGQFVRPEIDDDLGYSVPKCHYLSDECKEKINGKNLAGISILQI
jgi:hypothetical protein